MSDPTRNPATLPVLEALPALRAALASSPLVLLGAPPGAGKSTGLPLELLDEPWLAGRTIVMLQPRRVAARSVAARLAETLGEEVGGTAGYRVRFESRVSARTRIEVVTEGVLTRRLQNDPELTGVGLVVFDEFHERSLHADLGLALCREVQGALRDDLRVLVMSATLDPTLADRLGGVPFVASAGRAFPVEVRFEAADPTPGAVPELAARAARAALAGRDGDVLVFLPGLAEIRRAGDALADLGPGVRVLPLHGELPLDAQRAAILPDPEGRRRVVLATSIAETSLTLPNVRVVVDGGLVRRPVFDPATGLSRLVTARVTRDAADQRAGRAGRTAPGLCLRLWSERTDALLAPARPPELLEADLAPTRLELARWGSADLPWLDPPPAKHLAAATELLTDLDALDPDGRLTPVGARLLDFPTHPRLAHLLLEGAARGSGALAADVAALLEERDVLGRDAGADLTARVSALRAARNRYGRVEETARRWRRELRVPAADARSEGPPDAREVGALVALAYPERVAARRPGDPHRFRLASGRGARLPEGDDLAGEAWLAVAHADLAQAEGRVFLAAPLDPAELAARAREVDVVAWDGREGVLVARREKRVGALVLEERPLRDPPPGVRREALLGALCAEGPGLLDWTPEARALRARVLSLRAWRPDEGWPDLSDAGLLENADGWLGDALDRVRRREDFARIDVRGRLAALLDWRQVSRLDELAPAKLTVPSGSAIRLDYADDGAPPVLAVKLQEMFGLADTPAVNGGRTKVLLHLLSPAGRPVQVTQDLRSFWERTYATVRKELRGDYPRHPWPEDPWNAPPTRRVKPRGT